MMLPPRPRDKKKADIPLTPLVDIVFLLLIYFLLTTNYLVKEGIQVQLPNATASAPVEKTEITVVVDRTGKTFLQDREVSLAGLSGFIKEKTQTGQCDGVVIRADRSTVLNAAVMVMDVARASGATRLSLATERKESR